MVFKGAKPSPKKTVAPLNAMKGIKHKDLAYTSQMIKRANPLSKEAKRFKGAKSANA